MKSSFGLIGLLVALAIVGLLVKKQMTSVPQVLPPVPGASAVAPAATTVQQSRQLQQQVQQQVQQAMQPRPDSDAK